MGSPAGMADAHRATHSFALAGKVYKILQLTGGLDCAKAAVVINGNSGGVVSAIFKTAETIEQYRRGLFPAYVAYYSTHLIYLPMQNVKIVIIMLRF